MAAIASTDVTVTVRKRTVQGGMRRNFGTIAFGDGALTYPTGGVPLPAKAYFGIGGTIQDIKITGGTGVYSYEYDKTNHKVLIYGLNSHTHDMLFIGGIATTEAVMVAGGDTLGKNAATNRTIAGADVATKGGVKASTVNSAPFVEMSTALAPAATTLRFEVIGR